MRAKEYVYTGLRQVVQDLGLTWPSKVVVEPSRDECFGDLATNVAMLLAKEAKQAPRRLAEQMMEPLQSSLPELKKIEVAGPGFLNLTLSPGFWQQEVREVLTASDYGRLQVGQGKKVLIEYVSANPTGPLHIGHGRGAAVGDALARIMRKIGYEVSTEYYLNDAGRQMQLLGRSIWLRYQQLFSSEVLFEKECYQGEYIKELAKDLAQEHGAGLLELNEAQALDICQVYGQEKILAGIKQDLQVFRVEHQSWFSEQGLVKSGEVEKTLDWLLLKGLAYEQDGALWFKSSEFGDDKDRVLKKSSGDLTYFASDIAYHAHKFSRGFDLLIDIWGADHHGYIPRMKSAIRALGRDPEDLQVILIQLVSLLRKGVQVSMSTRAGQFETLADVCAEVGTDAARFVFLTRKSDSPLEFDLELLKEQSMDNPVYYVQYAHARICSMMRKAMERGIVSSGVDEQDLSGLVTKEDLNLLKLMERYPDVLEGVGRTLSPHHLSYYLQQLAGSLHRYYNKNPILSLSDPDLLQARLILMQAVARVLRLGLELLGVSAPEKM